MNPTESPPTTRREQMYALIECYLSSDQTQINFCQKESISRSTFAYWLKRYRQDKLDGSLPAFRPIPIRLIYCEDGCLEIDNNLIENTIQPIALGSKNYLFAGSHHGAQRAAIIYLYLAG